MTSVNGRQRLLNEYIGVEAQRRYTTEGFQWGKFDCIHFIGDWILKCTGEDVIAPYRGTYNTKEQAEQVLQGIVGGLKGALAAHLGEPIHPALAHRGDIAYFERPGDIGSCGIMFTSSRMMGLFLLEQGFSIQRARDVTCAFKVGR